MKNTDWLKPKHHGRSNRQTKPIAVRNNKRSNSNSSGAGGYITVIRFTTPAMQKFRWMVGDRLLFKVEDNCILVRRSIDGFSLSSTDSKPKTRGKKIGTMTGATVRVGSNIINKNFELNLDEIEFDGDLLVIPCGDQS